MRREPPHNWRWRETLLPRDEGDTVGVGQIEGKADHVLIFEDVAVGRLVRRHRGRPLLVG